MFKQIVVLQECNAVGAPGSLGTATIPARTRFSIDGVTAVGTYIISIPNWNLPKPTASSFAYYNGLNTTLGNAGGVQHYFLLTPAQYNLWAKETEPRGNFAVYASSTLVKIRPGRERPRNGYPVHFNFTNDVNLGVMAGVRWSNFLWLKNFKVNTLIGFGVSSIPVDAETTENKVTSATNQAAITPSFAIVGEFDKFQFGVSTGIDLMSGETGRHWLYRRRPWVGVGFGFNIFRAQGEEGKKQ